MELLQQPCIVIGMNGFPKDHAEDHHGTFIMGIPITVKTVYPTEHMA